MMPRKSGTKQRPWTDALHLLHDLPEFGLEGCSVDCSAIQSGNGGAATIVVALILSCLYQNASEAEDAEMALYVQRVQKSVDNLLPHSPSAGFSGTAT